MYANLGIAEVQRIKQLEKENLQLKQLGGGPYRYFRLTSTKGVLIEEQREMVGEFRENIPSERRACRAFQVNHASFRYSHKENNPANGQVRKEIRQLARRNQKYGTPRITWRLQKCGYRVNHKRVEQLYAFEKLQILRKRAKKKYMPTGWCRLDRTRSGPWISCMTGLSTAES